MVDVPAVRPLTTPAASMLATVVLLLFHVPSVVVLLSAVVLPAQTEVVPVIDAGNGSTVMLAVALQPVPSV